MTSRFPPFAFVELVSPYNKKNITRWLEDMNFMFSWQEQYLTRSLRSLVRYSSCHSNIKFISSRHRVISSIYFLYVYSTISTLPFLQVPRITNHQLIIFLYSPCLSMKPFLNFILKIFNSYTGFIFHQDYQGFLLNLIPLEE